MPDDLILAHVLPRVAEVLTAAALKGFAWDHSSPSQNSCQEYPLTTVTHPLCCITSPAHLSSIHQNNKSTSEGGSSGREGAVGHELWVSFGRYWQIFLAHQSPGCWQVAPDAGRSTMGICRSWKCWAGVILQGLRALEAAAIHPFDLFEFLMCGLFVLVQGFWFGSAVVISL